MISEQIALLSRGRFDRPVVRRQVGRIRDRSAEFQVGRAIRGTDRKSPASGARAFALARSQPAEQLDSTGRTGTSRIRYVKARHQALKPGRRFVGAESVHGRSRGGIQ